jgi:NAD(P)H-hydrate epimerase
MEARVLELMTARLDPGNVAASLEAALAGKRALIIGPGLGTDDRARQAVEHVLSWDGVKILDADALTIFAGRADRLVSARGALVLTPHSGEAGRLIGKKAQEVESDRLGSVREIVARTRAIVVLKGARTIIATPEGGIFINTSGNPALATAGAGDVLAGIIGAFACELAPERAACAGVHLHGLAADAWRAQHGGADRGLFASEIADLLPSVLGALARGGLAPAI